MPINFSSFKLNVNFLYTKPGNNPFLVSWFLYFAGQTRKMTIRTPGAKAESLTLLPLLSPDRENIDLK